MTEAPLPRWFRLAMAPILAAAAFCVDFELQSRIARKAHADGFDDASTRLIFWGELVGPLLAACLIAYPLARLYGKDWKLACVGVLVPIALFYGFGFFDAADPFGSFAMLLKPVVVAILLPAAVAVARLALGGSRLVVVPDGGTPAPGGLPTTLQVTLLAIFVIAMFIVRDVLDPVVAALATLPATAIGDRVGLMIAALLGPAALAAVFAFPIARIYGRQSVLVGALVPMLCLWWSRWMLEGDRQSFAWLLHAVELASLLVLPPLAAWWAARRFRGTRLAIAPVP